MRGSSRGVRSTHVPLQLRGLAVFVLLFTALVVAVPQPDVVVHAQPVPAGGTLRVNVPEAAGGKTVIGQLTVQDVLRRGYVTAWDCSSPMPEKSDLNYDGFFVPGASNRLIVTASQTGDVCFYTSARAELIVDVSAVTTAIEAITPTRFDTRDFGSMASDSTLRLNVPEAVGGKTVVGQLTVDNAARRGYVTAWDCSTPMPVKSDLNYDGTVRPVASNRLIVTADADGNVCFYTKESVDLVVDVIGVTDAVDVVANQRTDTRETGTRVERGAVGRVNVPQAAGGEMVIGQLTVDWVLGYSGYVTAWDCSEPRPLKSDLNFNGFWSEVSSNRLVVNAAENGDVCFFFKEAGALIVDVSGVSDEIEPIENRRFDTRNGSSVGLGTPPPNSHICEPGETDVVGVIYGRGPLDELGNPSYWRVPYCAD